MLRRGNVAYDAPASSYGNAGALQDAFTTRSVGTINAGKLLVSKNRGLLTQSLHRILGAGKNFSGLQLLEKVRFF